MLIPLAMIFEAVDEAEAYVKPAVKTKKRKPYEKPQADAPETGNVKNVGALIRHCMVAIARGRYRKRDNKWVNGKGFGPKGARAAWNICRWAMTKYKFMKSKYRKGAAPTKHNLKMTGKGTRRNMKHATGACPRFQNTPERKALAKKELPLKQRLFKRLFKYIRDPKQRKGK